MSTASPDSLSDQLSHLHRILAQAKASTASLRETLAKHHKSIQSLQNQLQSIQDDIDEASFTVLLRKQQRKEFDARKQNIIAKQERLQRHIDRLIHTIHMELDPLDIELLKMYKRSIELIELHRERTMERVDQCREESTKLQDALDTLQKEMSVQQKRKQELTHSIASLDLRIQNAKRTTEVQHSIEQMEERLGGDKQRLSSLQKQHEDLSALRWQKAKEMHDVLLAVKAEIQAQQQWNFGMGVTNASGTQRKK